MLEEGREVQKPESTTCASGQSQDGALLSPALGIFDDIRILLLYIVNFSCKVRFA